MNNLNDKEKQALREQSKQWHYNNVRSGHNPYHPRNGSVANCILANLSYMQWHRIADPNLLGKYQGKVEIFIRNISVGVECYYKIRDRAYYASLEYDNSESVVAYIAQCFNKDTQSDIKMFDYIAMHFISSINLKKLEDQLPRFKHEHELQLIAADNAYLKMLQDKVSGE